MNLRRLMLVTVLVIATLLSIAVYASNSEMTLEEVNGRLNEVECGIVECDKKLDLAHTMAETARQLGLPEDDEVITKAQDIYEDNFNEKESLLIEKESLNVTKVELESRPVLTYIGDFKLTGYCPCKSCSGGYGGRTASGAVATEGITVAADTRVIPMGTKIYIEGVGERIVQDVGGAVKGKKIDVFVGSHGNCYRPEYNQKSAKVYIIS